MHSSSAGYRHERKEDDAKESGINEKPVGLSPQVAERILKDMRISALIELIVEDIEQYFEVNQFEIQPSDEG